MFKLLLFLPTSIFKSFLKLLTQQLFRNLKLSFNSPQRDLYDSANCIFVYYSDFVPCMFIPVQTCQN